MKSICACCGFKTISEMKEICPVCFWEEDCYQEEFIDDEGGPNTLVSLRKARENYKKYGYSHVEYKNDVRKPTDEEKNI